MIIGNKYYALELDDATGNILRFSGVTGYNYIEKETPLIRLQLLSESGERTVVCSDKFVSSEKKNGALTLRYENMGGLPISVTATVAFDKTPYLRWRLSLENGSDLRTESVQYPALIIKNRLSPDGFKLFWPAMEGAEITDVNFRTELMSCADGTVYPVKGWQGVYPGACQMQFMSYYNGEHGMYFASHDDGGRYKLIEWMPENDGIRLIQQVYAEENDFVYDYDVVLGAFAGDWYDAAEIYREWATHSDIISFPKLKDNKELPEWLFEPLTVITFPVRGTHDTDDMKETHYYPYEKCLPYIDKYREFFGNRQMVLLMHWESTAPWAPPHVWPPYGDKKSFDALERGIHERGDLFGLYCSGLGWTQKSLYVDYDRTKDFEEKGLKDCVQVGPTREILPTTTCNHIREGYELCPACEKVKRLAADEAAMISGGTDVDYLQFFDQNLGGNTYSCYSDKHGHPPIPGAWTARESADIAERMRAEFSGRRPNKKMLIGCEAAACEPLMNNMRFNDIRYNLNFMYGMPVPAYNYVYGEYVRNYMGNHTAATRLLDTQVYPDNIFMRTAYSFAQGDVLTFMLKNDGKVNWEWNVPWNDDNEPDQDEYLRFCKLLNDFRNGILKDALQFGRMEKPVPITCGKYLEKVERKGLIRVCDEVTHTRFITENGEDFGIFVNFNDRPITFTLRGKTDGVMYVSPTDRGKPIVGKDIGFDMAAHSVLVIKQ